MASILTSDEGGSVGGRPVDPLCVGELTFSNAASKFWTTLMDELSRRFAGFDGVTMTSVLEAPLSRRYLFPHIIRDADIGELHGRGADALLRDALSQIELQGMPACVLLEVSQGGRSLYDEALPQDCLDAETFPYMLVWLLEWAGIPQRVWNDPEVAGCIHAGDFTGTVRCDWTFRLKRTHLSEGLHRIVLNLRRL